jgi:trans-aconitate methyltransferase
MPTARDTSPPSAPAPPATCPRGPFNGPFAVPAPRPPPRWERLERLPDTYFALAQDYERRTTLFPGWRERLIQRLAPRRGDTVIDVGCGPGLNFAALQARIGPSGTIIGIDESPQLLTVAAHHAVLRGWNNVQLINAPTETAKIPAAADAALFCAAHDVLQSPAALTHIVAHLRPDAAIAAGGWKWPSRWLWPLRLLVTALHSPYLTDVTGLDQPWRLLADHVTHLRLTEVGFGTGYLAYAHTRATTTRDRDRDYPASRVPISTALTPSSASRDHLLRR